MANLGKKDGVYVVRFRYQGKEFKKSLRTRSETAAKAALHLVELTIHRLHTGQVVVRDGVDAGDFIVSGGTWSAPPAKATPQVFPPTAILMDRYIAAREGQIAESYRDSQRTHLSHLRKFLGKLADERCNLVNRTLLENYLRERKKTRDGETVNREQITIKSFYDWVMLQDDIPTFPYPAEKLPRFKGSRDRDPFKTVEEIQAVIDRGGLDERQSLDQWECLYLDPAKIAALLATVQERAQHELSVLLHAIPAYTGMRRGEMLRLSWSDVDLTYDYVTARSRKQSRSQQEVSRRIDLHPDLKARLMSWKQKRPQGQLVLSREGTWEPLALDRANALFWQPMRSTEWCLDTKRNWFKLGFHTYRHSFASNLAAAGVDQRIIDEFMGHTTEAMRRRYRHLFPQHRRSAILSLKIAVATDHP
ncbi:MAG: site-specific integrase [Planctomycetaceae bacterium]|nr:site-specific integrase [Planctomycetaceae bacterium]